MSEFNQQGNQLRATPSMTLPQYPESSIKRGKEGVVTFTLDFSNQEPKLEVDKLKTTAGKELISASRNHLLEQIKLTDEYRDQWRKAGYKKIVYDYRIDPRNICGKPQPGETKPDLKFYREETTGAVRPLTVYKANDTEMKFVVSSPLPCSDKKSWLGRLFKRD
jgi:hypothetical protein